MTRPTHAPPRRAVLLAVAVPVAMLAGCGPGTGGGGGASPSSSPTPAAMPSAAAVTDANGWHAVATVAGGAVRVVLTVPGPLQVQGGCVAPLVVWVIAPGQSGATAPGPTPGVAQCMAITLEDIPAGATRTFIASLRAPVAPGVYTVHGLLHVHLPRGYMPVRENLPVLTLHL